MELNKIKFNEKGFTLIEMIMVIAIVSFAFAGIAALFTGLIMTRNANEKIIMATAIAEKKMEEIRYTPFSQITPVPSPSPEIISDLYNSYTKITKITNASDFYYLVEISVQWYEPLRNQEKNKTYNVASYIVNGGLNEYFSGAK